MSTENDAKIINFKIKNTYLSEKPNLPFNSVISFAYVEFQSNILIFLSFTMPNFVEAFITYNNIISNELIRYKCTLCGG